MSEQKPLNAYKEIKCPKRSDEFRIFVNPIFISTLLFCPKIFYLWIVVVVQGFFYSEKEMCYIPSDNW